VTTSDIVLVTVLGSCVTACVRDRDKGLGGMNHFMLPQNGGEPGVLSSSARYGAYAMEVLLNHLLKLGARRSSLEAKVFGGGKVLASLSQAQVGKRTLTLCSTIFIPSAYPSWLRIFSISIRARSISFRSVGG
jgi:chemotaxis protein CheD